MTDSETVTVDDSLARTAEPETFATPDSVFRPHLATDGKEEPKSTKPSVKIPSNLLVFPIKKIHDLAAKRSGDDNLRMSPEMADYWKTLADYFIERYAADLEKLDLAIAMGGLAVCYAEMAVEHNDWRKTHPKDAHGHGGDSPSGAPPAGAMLATNPASDRPQGARTT